MLVRNIIFARFLSNDNFATALTFGVVLSLFEYTTNFGHENFMQRSSAGDHPRFQATMHSVMVCRGVLVAALLILIAEHIPTLLNLKNINFNYAFLAIIPLINSFAHLDHQRFHRAQNYSLTAKIGLLADISSIFVAFVCVLIWDSYWGFYISFVFRHSITTLLSHVWAERTYSLAFEKTHAVELLAFGAPLLLVGLLKYVALEADKAVVAHFEGLKVFAVYVLTLMVVVNATNIVNVALSKIFIRRLSTSINFTDQTARSNGIINSFLIWPLIIILCMNGEDLIQLIFSHQYSPYPFLITWVCAVVGLRSMNNWLNQIVIAKAPTHLILVASLVRAAVVIVGIYLLYPISSAISVIQAFLVAELAYFICLTLLIQKRLSIVSSSLLMLSIYGLNITILFIAYTLSHDGSFWLRLGITLMYFWAFYTAFLYCSQTCRTQTMDMVKLIAKLVKT